MNDSHNVVLHVYDLTNGMAK